MSEEASIRSEQPHLLKSNRTILQRWFQIWVMPLWPKAIFKLCGHSKVFCVSACMHVNSWTWTACTFGWRPNGVFFSHLPPSLWKQSLSLNLDLTGLHIPGIHLPLPPGAGIKWMCCHIWLSQGCWVPNPSLQVCMSALQTEPPPQPPKMSFFFNFSEFVFPPPKYKHSKISVSKCKINIMNASCWH